MLGSPGDISVPAFPWLGAAVSRVQGWEWRLPQSHVREFFRRPCYISPVAFLTLCAFFSHLLPSITLIVLSH